MSWLPDPPAMSPGPALDTQPMVALPSFPVRLRFENVHVDFPTASGPMRVVDGVDLDIRQGEFVSIIGPSGCGKSTVFNMVGGFLKPTRGRVLLDDATIGPGPDRGVIFQEYGVFPWLTVRGNIEFGLRLAAARASGTLPRSSIATWR
jgi:NitT/TauT family transport system ATP-binding protein